MRREEAEKILMALHNALQEIKSTRRSEFETDTNKTPELQSKAYVEGVEVLDKYMHHIQEVSKWREVKNAYSDIR